MLGQLPLRDVAGEAIFACPIYTNYGRLILDGDYRRPLFQLSLGL